MILKVGWFVALFSIIAAAMSVAFATQQQIKKNDIKTKKVTATIAFADQNWGASKESNLQVIKDNPKDETAWFNLGLSQHYLGEHAEARKSFEKAIEHGSEPGINFYNIACTYAREGNVDQVLNYIQMSIDNDFPAAKFSDSDPDLEKVKTDPRFTQLIDKAKNKK